jgi:hypothetical protein
MRWLRDMQVVELLKEYNSRDVPLPFAHRTSHLKE